MEQLIRYFTNLFNTQGFSTKWHCWDWDSFSGWFFILSNIAIFLAYVTIPVLLLYFARIRSDFPFRRSLLYGALFIFTSGTTHLMDAVTFWWPAYRLSGFLHFLTAILSGLAIIEALRQIPKAFSMKSPAEFERMVEERTRSLAESEAKLRQMMEANLVGVIFWSLEGEILDANQAFLDMVGYTREEVETGKIDWRKMTPVESQEKDQPYIQTLLATGKHGPLEKQFIRKNGERIDVIVTSAFLEGSKDSGVGFVLDITERKQAERKHRESEEWFRLLVETVKDYAIFHEDRDGYITSWNLGAERIFGYSREEILGKHFSIFLTEVDITSGLPALELQTATTQGRFETEGIRLRKSGEKFWANVVITSILNDAGEVVGFSSITRDITEKRNAEEALKASEARFKQVYDANIVGMLFSSTDGQVYDANDAYLEMIGYDRSEFFQKGVTWKEITPPEFAGIDRRKARELQERGVIEPYEKQYVRKDGRRVDVLVAAALLPDTPQANVGLFIDITQRKEAERALQKLTEELETRVQERTAQLEAANRELESFSYSISHDLRAPLRSIDGFSKLALLEKAPMLDDEGKEYLQFIRENSQRMGQLIDDLLHLSRLGRAALKVQPLNLSDIATQLIEELRRQEPYRNVEVRIRENMIGHGDPVLIRAVLQNLIGNAWKFTAKREKGLIEFDCQPAHCATTFFIRDNGVGFDATYSGKLFGAFQRLHAMDEYPGSGVGLATVKNIIHRHGGEVWAEGEVNRGATFYFKLPEPVEALQTEKLPAYAGGYQP